MSKRKAPPPPAKAPAPTPLAGARLLLARELAKQGLAILLPDPTIVQSIVEQCFTTERSAQAALRQVVAEVGEQQMKDEDRDALRGLLHFRYEALYAQEAQAGRSEGAAKMLDRRAKLAGLFTEKGMQTNAPQATADEFEGRTEEELHFFTGHGYWPEEKPADNVVPIDPLARLRKQAK